MEKRPLYTLGKAERLKQRKLIELLFSQAKGINSNKLRLVVGFAVFEDSVSSKIAVTVPKKTFKRAVDRNRIKRLMREAFRLNKLPLCEQLKSINKQLAMVFIYRHAGMPTFEDMQIEIKLSLQRLIEAIDKGEVPEIIYQNKN